MTQLKAKSTTEPKKLAAAIAGVIKTEGTVEIIGIGASAVNQIVKSIIVASSYLIPIGINLASKMSFDKVELGEDSRTAIKFTVETK